ncbi:hypothetical protein BBA71_06395 [Acetobacter pasteurianus]|nr:hypothetical protein BBA71_06395 [Acetobacter pasteurianus]
MVSLLSIENVIGSIGRYGTTAPVTLGSVPLYGMEIPDVLTNGGQQRLEVHWLPGGTKIVDRLGNDPARFSWNARFTGPNALARAQLLSQMRDAGQPVPFTGPGINETVIIAEYAFDYSLKGAIIPYRIQLERQSTSVTSASTSTSALSSLIGDDAASALSDVTSALSDGAQALSNISAQGQAVIGQVFPLANMVGAGSALASVSDKLTMVQGLSGAGINLASAPDNVASIVTGLKSTGASLMTTISQAGANISGISIQNGSSLSALTANAGLQSATVDSGALVNRGYANTLTAGDSNGSWQLVSAAA